MAITPSADDYRGTFGNGYPFSGHDTKDKATQWAQAVETAVETLEGETVTNIGGKLAVDGDTDAIPVTHSIIQKTITDDDALTLADGTAGQVLVITAVAITGGKTGTLTPTTKTGYVTGTVGWIVLGSYGAAVDDAPLIALS